jgi:coproporphyrinogen III oxidase-like Fe-S oxidoreductase
VERDGHGSTAEEILSPGDRAREMLLMGLRLSEGIDARRFFARTEMQLAEAMEPEIFEQALAAGYLVVDGPILRATAEGRLRLDALLAALVI